MTSHIRPWGWGGDGKHAYHCRFLDKLYILQRNQAVRVFLGSSVVLRYLYVQLEDKIFRRNVYRGAGGDTYQDKGKQPR